jgi:dipeptidyl aminopeptidase/acylaminoacyl peptidase
MVARIRSLVEPRWSPDGSTLAYLESFDGRCDVMLAPADGGAVQRLTTDPGVTPAASYGGGSLTWLDAQTVVFVAPDGSLHAQAVVGGPSRQITRVSGRCSAPTASASGRIACMVTTERDQHIAIIDPSDAEWPVRASMSGDFVFDPAWAADGSLAWHEWNVPNMSWDGGHIRMRRPDGTIVEVDGAHDVSVSQPRFSPDGRTLAYACDRSGWWNVWLHDLASGSRRQLIDDQAEHAGPIWGPGSMRFTWSPDSRRLAIIRASAGSTTLVFVDVATGETRQIGPAGGVFGGVSWSPSGDRVAVTWSSPKSPARLLVIDPNSGVERVVAHAAAPGFDHLPAAEMVSWASTDGVTVHGILQRPAGVERPPLLTFVHGGPHGGAETNFNPRVAYWVDHGWAALQVNYRGSYGYGRDYMQALRDNWGVHDVNDTVSGALHLAERGLVDRERMAVMGGSAGGFTVLLCLALYPRVFAAGVNLYGVTDLFALSEETHRFEAHYLDSIVGTLPSDYQRYLDRSPVTHADTIERPVLILQGDSDEVVPKSQSEAIYQRLKARGVECELQVYEGEGHGWRKLATVMDEYARVEKFLRRHVLHVAK